MPPFLEKLCNGIDESNTRDFGLEDSGNIMLNSQETLGLKPDALHSANYDPVRISGASFLTLWRTSSSFQGVRQYPSLQLLHKTSSVYASV